MAIGGDALGADDLERGDEKENSAHIEARIGGRK